MPKLSELVREVVLLGKAIRKLNSSGMNSLTDDEFAVLPLKLQEGWNEATEIIEDWQNALRIARQAAAATPILVQIASPPKHRSSFRVSGRPRAEKPVGSPVVELDDPIAIMALVGLNECQNQQPS